MGRRLKRVQGAIHKLDIGGVMKSIKYTSFFCARIVHYKGKAAGSGPNWKRKGGWVDNEWVLPNLLNWWHLVGRDRIFSFYTSIVGRQVELGKLRRPPSPDQFPIIACRYQSSVFSWPFLRLVTLERVANSTSQPCPIKVDNFNLSTSVLIQHHITRVLVLDMDHQVGRPKVSMHEILLHHCLHNLHNDFKDTLLTLHR
jgi:hypothetical protein